jgi:hypothetical protein
MSAVPRPRSGFQMSVYAAEDMLFVYGGYSREKDSTSTSKNEGRIHEDLWQLNLKQLLVNAGRILNPKFCKLMF